MSREIAPWQVWWANFDPHVGREQAGQRPAIIVGTAFACQLPNQLAFVVPCTTTERQLPFHPRVTAFERATFAMCDQLKSISRDRLIRRHPAHLGDMDIDAIRFVLTRMVDVR
jgi:mRNA interferase MazF